MILVISDLWMPFPGGAERLIFNLARDLQHRGETVHVLTDYAPARQFDGPPLTIESIGVRDNHAAGAKTIADTIDTWQPDVIVTHHFFAYEFETELAESGIPVVQVVLNNRRLECAALAVYISADVANRPDISPRPGDVIVTPPAFADVVARSHGDGIGFIKPIHHKGVDLVYDIARLLPERRFVILRGEWQDIEVIEDLPNVEFLNPVDDIRTFYRECRLVLMPSISEDAGTVAQEAALNRLPCISSNVGGLVETNAGGIRLDSRDPADWVSAIVALDDPVMYQTVVDRQSVQFESTGQSDRLEDLHRRIRALM